jgi:hypothetical protein
VRRKEGKKEMEARWSMRKRRREIEKRSREKTWKNIGRGCGKLTSL